MKDATNDTDAGFEFDVLFCGTGAADHDWARYGARGVRGSCCTLLNGRVLLDCGTTGFRSLVRFGGDPRRVRELWFTHSHSDHCAPGEIAALLEARRGLAPLRIRGSAPLLARLGEALAPLRGRFVPVPCAPGEPFRAQGWRVTPLLANHLTGLPGETPLHYLVAGRRRTLLYALDGAWMTAAARRAIGSARIDLAVWDATVEQPGDWRIYEHNDVSMVRTIAGELRRQGVLRPGAVLVLDHLARTLWRTPIRAPKPFRVARDGLRLRV